MQNDWSSNILHNIPPNADKPCKNLIVWRPSSMSTNESLKELLGKCVIFAVSFDWLHMVQGCLIGNLLHACMGKLSGYLKFKRMNNTFMQNNSEPIKACWPICASCYVPNCADLWLKQNKTNKTFWRADLFDLIIRICTIWSVMWLSGMDLIIPKTGPFIFFKFYEKVQFRTDLWVW